MLHTRPKEEKLKAVYTSPIFVTETIDSDLPKYKRGQKSIDPELAYHLIQDELC